MTQTDRQGVLLLNLGTPRGPSAGPVRAYLKEFLMDPWVIDLPLPLRWALVHGLILPRRPARAAEAYRKIWTERGSPLLFHHLDLAAGVQARLGDRFQVEAAMRYGDPSIGEALERFSPKSGGRNAREILVVPLYPQYSLAATRSSVERCRFLARGAGLNLSFLPAFYDSPHFIGPFAQVIREGLDGYAYEHLLFSFHGLPERHMRKVDESGSHCLKREDCCERVAEVNRDCYRAQCFATARALASELGLARERYTVCFQSRLGRTPWIGPYTDRLYPELAAGGIRRLAVACPAFVADCLETLEEIAIRGREDFRRAGGEELRLIPSLNSSVQWVDGLSTLIKTRIR